MQIKKKKKLIAKSPSLKCIWLPTVENISENFVFAMIPNLLFNFIAWCSETTDEMDIEEKFIFPKIYQRILFQFVKVLSFFFFSKCKKQTHKRLSLAMALRHVTGSAKIINLLNNFALG